MEEARDLNRLKVILAMVTFFQYLVKLILELLPLDLQNRFLKERR